MVKWEEILKVQVLGNKQKVKMGNIPIPTEDDTNCIDTLRQWHNNAYALQNGIWQHLWDLTHEKGYTYSEGDHAPRRINEEKFKTIPEGVACKTIEIVNQFKSISLGSITDGENSYLDSTNYISETCL